MAQMTNPHTINAITSTGNGTELAGREDVAHTLSRFDDKDQAKILQMMEHPEDDEHFLSGLNFYLDKQANARFLHTLKLEKTGHWMGKNAPARLQIRLMEAAKSSQHAAYFAFLTGLKRSEGLKNAFPEA